MSKTLPHRENGSPAGASTDGPRTTPHRGSRPLTSGHRPWLGVAPLASARASTPTACLPLAGGRGTTTGQRPHRLGLGPFARLWCRGRLGMRDGPALSRCGRDIGTGAVGGRVPLLPLKRPAWSLLWRSRPWDISVGSRRTLEEPVKPGRHPLGVVAAVVTVTAVLLIGGFFFRLPLCLDFTRRASNAWRSRFFFFSSFFFESFADFCF